MWAYLWTILKSDPPHSWRTCKGVPAWYLLSPLVHKKSRGIFSVSLH